MTKHKLKRFYCFQLRLDFNMFVIGGPSMNTNSVALVLNGMPTTLLGVKAANFGKCLTDSFCVSNPTGTSPPIICGTNTEQHSKQQETLI